MTSDLLVSATDNVHELTLNRPDSGNSLSADLVEALLEQLERSSKDGVRLLVLRGTGRHFCTGFDLSDLDSACDAELAQRFIRIEQLLASIWMAPFQTLAIGAGQMTGAGADLFAACERRIATPTSTLRFPGAAFGIILGSRRLAARIGTRYARELIASGRAVGSAAALEIGLVTALADEADLGEAIEIEQAMATRLDRRTLAAVREATRDDPELLKGDLAALVRSAAIPGLASRLKAFREAALADRAIRLKQPAEQSEQS